jgi:hypothetical protein
MPNADDYEELARRAERRLRANAILTRYRCCLQSTRPRRGCVSTADAAYEPNLGGQLFECEDYAWWLQGTVRGYWRAGEALTAVAHSAISL